MISNYRIEKITAEMTLELRKNNLKPFKSLKDCVNEEDHLVTTAHFGLLYSDRLVSVATVFPQSHPNFSCGCPFRLRGMATDSNYRGQGFGSALLMTVLDYLKEKRCDLVWCNARIKAMNFYKDSGFQSCGEMFELPEIGLHKVMYKRIIPK